VKIDTTASTATIAFVPEKTSVEKLIRALETEGFEVLGSPKLLK